MALLLLSLRLAVRSRDAARVRELLSAADPDERLRALNHPRHYGESVLVDALTPPVSDAIARLLIDAGASPTGALETAVQRGDPAIVDTLIRRYGADPAYRTESGSTAVIDACYGRDLSHDARLLGLLQVLIDAGAPLDGISSYGETAVWRLWECARVDAIRLLIDAGAPPGDFRLSELAAAVAEGALDALDAAIDRGGDLEERDEWKRTPLLLAAQMGRVAVVERLVARGARLDARGTHGAPALFFATENHHAPMARWLLDHGVDPEQTDNHGDTALDQAVRSGDAEIVNLLCDVGVDVRAMGDGNDSPLYGARSGLVAARLLRAGANPAALSWSARRGLLGYPSEADAAQLVSVTPAEYERYRTPRFGQGNPDDMTNPFWTAMIRAGVSAYAGALLLAAEERASDTPPTWCAQRFGQSLTLLPDGRIVQVAGEHEDGCDPDFCIYNDVIVHAPGGITIYGYPESVFPPTDFHTATLVGDSIYIVGSLGYAGARRFGETPVYRLDTGTFIIEALATTGDKPGWISRHRSDMLPDGVTIRCCGGGENAAYLLDTATLTWRREAGDDE